MFNISLYTDTQLLKSLTDWYLILLLAYLFNHCFLDLLILQDPLTLFLTLHLCRVLPPLPPSHRVLLQYVL